MLLTTAYFPPIEYFSILAKYSVVYLEAHEKYQKQSWRNRCRILTANGPMDLNFPIVHDGATLIKDIKVDWSTPWLHKTEYAIDSAYFSSPFFEYYRDELFAILDSHPETLWELNLGIIDFFCRKIGICPQIIETSEFIPAQTDRPRKGRAAHGTGVGGPCSEAEWWGRKLLPTPVEACQSVLEDNGPDCRYSIHPKVASEYKGNEYWQVFKEKFGFVGNLSIMDLLFNEGPESLCNLR